MFVFGFNKVLVYIAISAGAVTHRLGCKTSLECGTSLAVGSNYVDKVVVTFWVSAETALFGLFQFREVPPKVIGFAGFLAK